MAYEAGNVNDADTVAVMKKLVSIEAGEARMIPLNHLRLSALNARKVRDPETIPVLAATIVSSGGLLNPLAVVAEKKRGSKAEAFGVVAGGRRLAALQYLAEHGTIQADEPISCRVVELSDAAGVSLVENVTQEAMHPADQLEAFKKLQDEGKTIGQIAAAFGVSALTVERRLKLANLAPEFIELFRDNKIEQAQLQALALTDNQEDQRRVWQALPPYERSAYRIGHMLTQEEVSGTSRAARLVGVEAYRAAGGTIRTDLFAEDGDGVYFQDAVLLEKLASEKLEAAAEALRADGWKWVEARNTFERHERGQFSQLSAKRREPTAEERRSMDELQQQADALSARIGELEAITEYDSEADEEGEYRNGGLVESDGQLLFVPCPEVQDGGGGRAGLRPRGSATHREVEAGRGARRRGRGPRGQALAAEHPAALPRSSSPRGPGHRRERRGLSEVAAAPALRHFPRGTT